MVTLVARPDIGHFMIGDLFIDPRYQRRLRAARLKELLAEWDPMMVGAIAVNMRDDGSIAVVDGQHRLRAMEAAGGVNQEIKALVYYGLTIEQEARLFDAFNGRFRKQTTALENLRARLVYHEPVAVLLEKVIIAAELEINWAGYGRKEYAVSAVSAAEQVLRSGGQRFLLLTLSTIRETWGGSSFGYTSSMIKGMFAFIAHAWPDYLHAGLVEKLAMTSPGVIVADSKPLQSAFSAHNDRAVALVIRGIYNKKRTKHWLPDFPDRVAVGKKRNVGEVLVLRAAELGVDLPPGVEEEWDW